MQQSTTTASQAGSTTRGARRAPQALWCCQAPGAHTGRWWPAPHFPAVPCIARHIFSAVSGVSRWRTPKLASASSTALATAAGAGTVDTDPIPFAPSGLVGDGTSSVSRMSGGTSCAFGMA